MDKVAWTILNNMYDSLDVVVERAQEEYNKLLIAGGVSELDDNILWTHGSIAGISHDEVLIEWETSWRYGGYDSGSYCIPVEALLDDTWEETVKKLARERLKKI